MRRFAAALGFVAVLALPAPALAFHHVAIPSSVCAADTAGSPGNDNGMAKEALRDKAGLFPPALPPVGTPGAGRGEGGEHCANA
jgi:hypothetical protein